jgi:site-specific recombinase XerD
MQKLMGHSNIKTTQIYAKLVDKKKDEAIDKLPNI